jgi:hypothetical protein
MRFQVPAFHVGSLATMAGHDFSILKISEGKMFLYGNAPSWLGHKDQLKGINVDIVCN